MIAVVVDTNILISALLNPYGSPAQVLLLCITHPEIQLCVSPDLYAEYEEVIHRPKFKRREDQIVAILEGIRSHAMWVKPTCTIRVCADPDDDMVLDCAQAAEAQYVITGNIRHFPSLWSASRIVTPREFLDAFS